MKPWLIQYVDLRDGGVPVRYMLTYADDPALAMETFKKFMKQSSELRFIVKERIATIFQTA